MGIDVRDAVPVSAIDDRHAPRSNRIMVLLNTDITGPVLDELGEYGKVHGWIDHRRIVAMTPRGQVRATIAGLPIVEMVEIDSKRSVTAVGSWDRDIIDVTDVEESFAVDAPDLREVMQTGRGVHVAVIDTGLPRNWRDFLPEDRVDTSLARAVGGGGNVDDRFPLNELKVSDPPGLWERDNIGHGLAVASHIIGFKISGLVVDGTAPEATLIPIKMFTGEAGFLSREIAAIDYVTRLKNARIIGPTVINLSVGGSFPSVLERIAIGDAIAAGIVLVSSAGNAGESGMGWPAAYPEMISAGAVGWSGQFQPGTVAQPNFAFWWTQDVGFDPDPASAPFEASEAFVASFSSRAILAAVPGFTQELDVLAPGTATVAPFGAGPNAGFFFISGTSFSSPLTAGVAALILEKNPGLTQPDVELIMKSTAQPMSAIDSRPGVLVPFGNAGTFTVGWDDDCRGRPCDPVGAGLLQADAALAATP